MELVRYLLPRQAAFVQEYLVDRNATQAAIRAGYSAKSAGQMGSSLLKNPKVAEEIARRGREIASNLEVTAGRIIQELAAIGFSNIGDYLTPGEGGRQFDWSHLSRQQLSAIAEVTVFDYAQGADVRDRRAQAAGTRPIRRIRFRLHDKLAALSQLAKYVGLFDETVEGDKDLTIRVVYEDRPIRGTECPFEDEDEVLRVRKQTPEE